MTYAKNKTKISKMKTKSYFAYLLIALTMALIAVIGWRVDIQMHTNAHLSVEQANRTVTRIFVNENWQNVKPLLLLGDTEQEIRRNPAADEIDSIVRQFARGTDLVNVKIFDARGTIVYSTDRSKLGKDDSANKEFLNAIKGVVSTEMARRDEMNGLNGVVKDIDVISSYVPIRNEIGVEAVVEVYTDITNEFTHLNQQWRTTMMLISTALISTSIGLWLLLNRIEDRYKKRLLALKTEGEEVKKRLGDQLDEDEDYRKFLYKVSEDISKTLSKAVESSDGGVKKIEGGEYEADKYCSTYVCHAHQKANYLMMFLESENEKQSQTLQVTNIMPIVEEAGERLNILAKKKKLEAIVQIQPCSELQVVGEPNRIKIVLSILIENALERTAGGCIQLRVHGNGESLCIDVIDTGNGLPREIVDEINDENYEGDRFQITTIRAGLESVDGSSDYSMLYAKRFTQAIGGYISCQSDEGSGSWISLKFKQIVA